MVLTIVGVMGPGAGASDRVRQQAWELGREIAQRGWVLLTGGRNEGVMEAASQGASQAGGLTVGILPGTSTTGMSEAIAIPILTGMGHARNIINVQSSHGVVACGMGLGTASEVAIALKIGKPVVLLAVEDHEAAFFQRCMDQMLGDRPNLHQASDLPSTQGSELTQRSQHLYRAVSPKDAIAHLEFLL